MEKKEKIIKALEILGKKLSGYNLNWIIGGSGSLLVHGLDVTPNDIDLVADPMDYSEIKRVLGDFLVNEDNGAHDDKTPFIVNGIHGDILVRTVDKNLVIPVKFGETNILVHKLEVELEYYKKRTDKVEANKQKIALIEKALNITKPEL